MTWTVRTAPGPARDRGAGRQGMTTEQDTPGEGESVSENRPPAARSADVREKLELVRHHACAGYEAETVDELMGTLDELEDALLSLRAEFEEEG